jgi:hypothetical protein
MSVPRAGQYVIPDGSGLGGLHRDVWVVRTSEAVRVLLVCAVAIELAVVDRTIAHVLISISACTDRIDCHCFENISFPPADAWRHDEQRIIKSEHLLFSLQGPMFDHGYAEGKEAGLYMLANQGREQRNDGGLTRS